MIVRDHPARSLSRQCRLLSIGRSSLDYEPKGGSTETLALMRRIDEPFLKYPFYDARRMALHLRREGVRIGRRRGQSSDAPDGASGAALRRWSWEWRQWGNGPAIDSTRISLVPFFARRETTAKSDIDPR